MSTYKVTIKDSKPQVGIFEIVDNILLIDSEDTQTVGKGFFDGTNHQHVQDIKRLVAHHPHISEETKAKFASNPNEYLNWPRGRVDYDRDEGKWHIMSSSTILSNATYVELLTRAFHLPPYLSGKIILEADEGHYGN